VCDQGLCESKIVWPRASYVLSDRLHARPHRETRDRFSVAGAKRQHRIRLLALFPERSQPGEFTQPPRVRPSDPCFAGQIPGPSGPALGETTLVHNSSAQQFVAPSPGFSVGNAEVILKPQHSPPGRENGLVGSSAEVSWASGCRPGS
jgi:hypothetical protein